MDASAVMGLVFAGSTALSGLILVFLGSILNAYDGFTAEAQNSVKKKFKDRAWTAFSGLLLSLTSAGFALSHELVGSNSCLFIASIILLALAGALLVVMAIVAVRDIR